MSRAPLFSCCARRSCGRVFGVRRPVEQRRRKYCSRRCAALVNQNITGAGSKGGLQAARVRRRRVLDRLDGLTVLQAFRLGYVRGLESKTRQIRKRFVLVPRKDMAA